jgi:serine/threonine protein kinase
MAAVYLAVHPTIGRKVALKIIHADLATDEESMARFFNEARAVTQIGHPHIVDVYDFGQTPSGESFIVMELLEGMSLGALLRKETSLSIERAVKIAVEICAGLSAAHVRGIIHRDLKPDNIFLIERNGVRDFVKIVDFGLAKLTGPGAVQHKTRTGVLLGTAHYMAPELAEDAKKVDHRIDVYALGCVLFEMIIGRVPFPGDGFGHILVRHIRDVPPMPSRLRADVPAWLEKIILHALAKNPAFRFASMDAFAVALRDPVAWERAFDEHEPSEHELIQPRTPTPARLAPVPAAPAPVVRAVQLPADAPTMMGPTSARPSPPPGERILSQATVVHDVVPSNERTTDPRPAIGSATASVPKIQSKTKSAVPGAILGAVGVLLPAAVAVYFVWTAPITLSIVTQPPGAEIIVGATRVAVSPAEIKLPRSHDTLVLTLQKPGYGSARRELQPVRDAALEVVLVAEAPVTPAAPVVKPVPPVVKATPPSSTVTLAPPPIVRAALPAPAEERKPARAHTVAAKKPKPPHADGVLLAPSF